MVKEIRRRDVVQQKWLSLYVIFINFAIHFFSVYHSGSFPIILSAELRNLCYCEDDSKLIFSASKTDHDLWLNVITLNLRIQGRIVILSFSILKLVLVYIRQYVTRSHFSFHFSSGLLARGHKFKIG